MLSKEQALDLVTEGLVSLAEATLDLELVYAGKIVYADVEDVFRAHLRPDESCLLAMPSILITPDIRPQCFVAVQRSQIIIAWRTGLFRKKTFYDVIPRSRVSEITYGRGRTAATRNAYVVTVFAGAETTFALPADHPDLGAWVKDAFLADQPWSPFPVQDWSALPEDPLARRGGPGPVSQS